MSRRGIILLAAGVLLSGLVSILWIAARASTTSAKAVVEMRSVTDMTGRTVRLPLKPVRILSLCTSATDTIIALGQVQRLAAIDDYSSVVPGSDKATIIGKGGAISREQVLALRIDLAFIWWYQDDAGATLEEMGVPVVRVRSARAAEAPALVRLIGDCINARDHAEKLASDIEAFVAGSAKQAPPAQPAARVFLELYGPFKTMGRETYADDLLTLAGAQNAASDISGTGLLSAEKLMAADPDAILLVEDFADPASLAQRPGMSSLRAVHEGRVVCIDRYWLVAGPNLPQSVAALRQAISSALSR